MAKVFREKTVLVVSLLFTSLFILLGIFFNTKLADAASAFLSTTIDYFGWFYLTAVMLFLLFSVFLMLSRYGAIRLGDDADRPEYSTASWLAMLFSAGMGIGLVFWGAAEPVFHYATPPVGEGSTAESAAVAMRYTFLHWGLHPWAIYTVIALSLAYAQFRKKLPALISSAFYPLLGERVHGPIGKTIDILAVFATVFGVATSLGLGTMQISGGMSFLFGLDNTISLQIGIIAAITVLYIYTAWSGVDRGIKTLSNLNMILALSLMLLLLIVGPTAQIFKILVNTTGSYINNIISMSLRLEPFRDDTWIAGWTLFYWAWWIAWAPFVGTFIARVSRGRTIREFILGVLVTPTLGTFVWFSTFGGSALNIIRDQGKTELSEKMTSDVSTALFEFFQYFPLSTLLSGIAVILVITFFATSANSATYVLGMLSSGGNMNPTNGTKLTWGLIQSSIAIVLLISGGLSTLQTVSIATAFPFAIIMVLMCYCLLKNLQGEFVRTGSMAYLEAAATAQPKDNEGYMVHDK